MEYPEEIMSETCPVAWPVNLNWPAISNKLTVDLF
jgi:hypothetical protein